MKHNVFLPFFFVSVLLSQSIFAQKSSVDARFVVDDPEACRLPSNCGTGGGIVSFGGWETSSMSVNSATVWSGTTGARAVWNPDIQVPGKVRVSVMKLKEKNRKNDPGLKIEIHCRGKISNHSIDCEEGSTGWVELGVFDFEGKGEERFHLVKETPGLISRCGSFLVEMLDPGFQGEVTSKCRLVPAAEIIDAKVFSNNILFDDLSARPESREIGFLLRRGLTFGSDGKYFHPDKPVSGVVFYDLLDGVLELSGVKASRNAILEKQSVLTLEDAVVIFDQQVKTMKRNVQWLDKRCPSGAPSMERMKKAEIVDDGMLRRHKEKPPLSRLDAFLLAKRFMQTFVLAGPPVDRTWKLTFEENFEGDGLDWNVWASQNGPSGHILSSRWKENVEVKNGLCRLIAKRETRAGQDWTAGSIWVKKEAFSQTYGYWEARYRYGDATGLNQSFWMDIPGRFEIDVNEGHWPNKINTNLHWFEKTNEKTVRKTKHEAVRVPENLADDFHTYACQWNDKEIIYYFDAREIFRKPVQTAHKPVSPILSLAVIGWAGAVTDAIDGKSMDVDWVRVYQWEQE